MKNEIKITNNRVKYKVRHCPALFHLYADITELCEVRKNLYRGKDPQKLAEYTLSNLLKNVRVLHKTKDNKKEDVKKNTKEDVK